VGRWTTTAEAGKCSTRRSNSIWLDNLPAEKLPPFPKGPRAEPGENSDIVPYVPRQKLLHVQR
jgi:hypothetical protein